MDALLSAAADLVAILSPARITSVAERIRELGTPLLDAHLEDLVGTRRARSALEQLVEEWAVSHVSADMLSGILLGAARAREQALEEVVVELVLTGPTTPFVPTRRTEQVLVDIIRRSEQDLFFVSFVAYAVPGVIAELNAAVGRGVDLHVLLEAGLEHGGTLSTNPVRMIRTQVPGARAYIWAEKAPPFLEGRVHAKLLVADGKVAVLTSANLTGHALEKNMEAGVVIEGGNIPVRLRSHLHALVDMRVIREVT